MIQKCYNWKENKTLEHKFSSKRVVVLMKYAKFFFAQISLKRNYPKFMQFGFSMHFIFSTNFIQIKKIMVGEMYTFIFYTNFIQKSYNLGNKQEYLTNLNNF